ncbi:MAG TPA: hypothetical protein VG106_04025, partial [Vicinamibacterales bacterium]|nr:hypothetical protein [Vicinamibacterales bacterium]
DAAQSIRIVSPQSAPRSSHPASGVSVSAPANFSFSMPPAEFSAIAGSVLPIQRAEELLATLPGVISVRVVAGPTGQVEEIHLLTSEEVSPKQTVRNVESALMAHLGMRVSHKKISVATTSEPARARGQEAPAAPQPAADGTPGQSQTIVSRVTPLTDARWRRVLYFEDIEVRRSRAQGVTCRVTLKKGDESFVGEAEGLESERMRIELAARATLTAIAKSGETRTLALEGCRIVEAFEHEFVFVGMRARFGRESVLLTGTAESKESRETAAVLAVLDATNRWIEYQR